jgi:thiol-disulfide isomerase/thioredoxin
MAGVKNTNFRSFNTLLIILLIFIIFGSIIAGFVTFSGKRNLFEGFASSSVSIEYYYMDGCGHCKEFSPTWDKFVSKIDSSAKFTTVKYNINTPEGSKRGDSFKVSSAPTILAVKNNEIIAELTGDRTLESLNDFANKHSS